MSVLSYLNDIITLYGITGIFSHTYVVYALHLLYSTVRYWQRFDEWKRLLAVIYVARVRQPSAFTKQLAFTRD
jgi:hypothetical protein